jgi:hypothetical protein
MLIHATPQYVCRCNMCWNLYINPNPNENSQKIPVIDGTMPSLKYITDISRQYNKEFWGCPKCLTDEFLMNDTSL